MKFCSQKSSVRLAKLASNLPLDFIKAQVPRIIPDKSECFEVEQVPNASLMTTGSKLISSNQFNNLFDQFIETFVHFKKTTRQFKKSTNHFIKSLYEINEPKCQFIKTLNQFSKLSEQFIATLELFDKSSRFLIKILKPFAFRLFITFLDQFNMTSTIGIQTSRKQL